MSRISPRRDGRSWEELRSGRGLVNEGEFEVDVRDDEQSDGHEDIASWLTTKRTNAKAETSVSQARVGTSQNRRLYTRAAPRVRHFRDSRATSRARADVLAGRVKLQRQMWHGSGRLHPRRGEAPSAKVAFNCMTETLANPTVSKIARSVEPRSTG
jgi:hypothetical protein